ncbi:hypothetical protein HEK616_47500 [Streptomyces nigrescens]|uniref:Methyltransferase domain-containing protein n=2 Tax=Streptomyces TaxID=1883 RepID=A0ABN6QYH6_STRNI|nr:class I SAM-dependent methyltransferase [Streptomyces nigrescens]MEE4421622.1 class I SAM-dependent methyltransferase [Streptomyces sp. DSM 41528]BDM71263.1 hypothetical protein HEK616_47500 [Streptomyces nigrescens]
MFSDDLATVYEMIYRSRGKDWSAEARTMARIIKSRSPGADSLLDVACGTGAHLETFRTLFGHVAGLELADPMRERAVKRLPGVPVHAGDMRDFALGQSFDAVVCLFTAIGYAGGLEDMRAAVRCMAGHLSRGGVLLVEPWWFPETFLDGYVAGDLARGPDRTVARVSHSTRQGRTTRMEVRFVVGSARGITEFTEIDELSLFTEEEYLAAFADAGCRAEFVKGGSWGRGLFIGTRV